MRPFLILNGQPVRCTGLVIRFDYVHEDDAHPIRYRLSYWRHGRWERHIARDLQLDQRPSGRPLVIADRKRA